MVVKHPTVARICKLLGIALMSGIGFVLALEVSYRFYWFDYYAGELKTYNSPENLDLYDIDSKDQKVLCLGDSFTAGASNYPLLLNRFLGPDYKVINSSIPGSGLVETLLVAKKRLRDFQPKFVVYQIYSGNDLFNINEAAHNGNWSTARRTYYKISQLISSLQFLNYRFSFLDQFFTGFSGNEGQFISAAQSLTLPEYNPREQRYLKADPQFFTRQIQPIQFNYRNNLDTYLKKLHRLADLSDKFNTQLIIVVVPHKIQVHSQYLNQYQKMGAKFADHLVQKKDYELFESINNSLASRPSIRVLNLLPYFVEHENQGLVLYSDNDPHLNMRGKTLLAQRVARSVKLNRQR